jgi:hypothetical protein
MVKFSFAYLAKNEELYSTKLNKKPSKNNGNMKAEFINEIGKKMTEAMKEAIFEGEHQAYIDHESGDFYITVEANEHDEVHIDILNKETDKSSYPNVAEAIRASIPSWSDKVEEIN